MDGLGMERMLLAIEGSLKITGRVQFFLWSQGALQGILPHDMLLCVFGDFASARFKYDVFSQVKIDQKIIDQIADPVDGLLQRIISDWVAARRSPCVYSPIKAQANDRLSADLSRCGFDHAIAHGAREINGSEGSFFVFFRHTRTPGPNDVYLLDMVMPQLHMALYRMLPNERDSDAIEVSPESILSTRELEVLRWVREGKTNQEIGQVLDISPLTVKNHVQKILRKLNVNNRAQAVAKGQSSRLFNSPPSARISISVPALTD
jgi:transcriptional regulator EpsA